VSNAEYSAEHRAAPDSHRSKIQKAPQSSPGGLSAALSEEYFDDGNGNWIIYNRVAIDDSTIRRDGVARGPIHSGLPLNGDQGSLINPPSNDPGSSSAIRSAYLAYVLSPTLHLLRRDLCPGTPIFNGLLFRIRWR
jgi:hypothetical protein